MCRGLTHLCAYQSFRTVVGRTWQLGPRLRTRWLAVCKPGFGYNQSVAMNDNAFIWQPAPGGSHQAQLPSRPELRRLLSPVSHLLSSSAEGEARPIMMLRASPSVEPDMPKIIMGAHGGKNVFCFFFSFLLNRLEFHSNNKTSNKNGYLKVAQGRR